MQRKCRVKIHIVTMRPTCVCTVNLPRVIATREPAAVLLSNLVNAQRSKINARYMYMLYQSRVRLKSTKCLISQSYICFCMHDRFCGCGLGVVNVIRTVRDFPLAKGARIIEVGLYPLNALFPRSAKICTCK